MGNSLQSSGNFLGTLVGSGVLLMLYSMIGWKFLMFLLAGIVLLALVPISRYKQKSPSLENSAVKGKKRVSLKDIPGFFKQYRIGRRVILLVLFYSGIVGILAMLKPYMVDLGYSIKEIAFMTGIFGTGLGAGSAFLGGFIMKKIKNKRALRVFTFYGFIGAAYMAFLTTITPTLTMLYVGIGLIWSAYGMCSVGVYTISMNTVRNGTEGTDYTLQIVLTHLSSLLIVVLSGRIGDWLGYTGLFFIEAALGLTVSFLVGYLYYDPELAKKPEIIYHRKSA
jgi:predicted MFS family arabinose efflux permease